MFTITHELSDGQQEVFSAVQVQYRPFTKENGNSAGVHFLCGPDEGGPGIAAGHVKTGTIYVMNDEGKTVARYHLPSNSATPSSDDQGEWGNLQADLNDSSPLVAAVRAEQHGRVS